MNKKDANKLLENLVDFSADRAVAVHREGSSLACRVPPL
jgi:hypothetical protein